MKVLNLDLQNQVLPQLKQALNSNKSQSFGRRIYQIYFGAQNYWLKLQIKNVSQQHQLSFKHEINQYQWISQHCPEILSPFQIMDITAEKEKEQGTSTQVLIVRHLDPLFQQPPNLLSLAEIKSTLIHSVEVLEKLHQLCLIHGDLKVEHFRKYQNRAVLIDLEQCICIESIHRGENTATPRYMAPELFHAAAKSFESDVYALGIIWLEWLTQRKLEQKSYLDWAKLHCQHLEIDLNVELKAFEPVLALLLHKQKALRCTNFYQIKQQLTKIV